MKSWKKALLIAIVLTAILGGILYYFFLPAINIKSEGMWVYTGILVVFFAVINGVGLLMTKDKSEHRVTNKISGTAIVGVAVAVVAFFVCFVASQSPFHAKRYSEIIEVQEDCSFQKDLAETLSTDAIAIMDTSSARKLGNRKIGTLSNLVSQYDVSEEYSQINYQDVPAKVAPLDYAGFFKYLKNKDKGIPGYVFVSPVDMSAKYVELEKNMQYVPSACFSKNLIRHIRTEYKSAMIWSVWFEIDEEGMPYYVASVYDNTIGLFGGVDIKGAILVDPVSGDMEYYDVANVPEWVDIVYDGDLLCEQYNYYGNLRNGFWNSRFSAEGCKVTTNDYGYIAMDGDIWVYTGVTSVNSDASNIGFVLMNERTKEAKFYTIAGADEQSAMNAAEGEVQQYGYRASFPSLINVEGNATYIMVLKDNGGLVKMYAAVNAEQYNIVATADDQKKCIDKYKKLLNLDGEKLEEEEMEASSNIADSVEEIDEALFEEKDIVIQKLESIVVDGNTYLYLMTDQGEIYHAKYVDVLEMLGVKEGQNYRIKVYEDWFLCGVQQPVKEDADETVSEVGEQDKEDVEASTEEATEQTTEEVKIEQADNEA